MSMYGNVYMLGNALRTFQYGLNVTANNLANASTVGYSRQRLNINSLNPSADGLFLRGNGVDAGDVQRIRDLFLDAQIRVQYVNLGRAQARKTALQELALLFPEVANSSSTAGLQGALNNLSTTWTALAAAPTSIAAKTSVRDALDAVAKMLNDKARQTYALQENLDQEIGLTITKVNTLIDRIVDLNRQATAVRASSGGTPNTILDAIEQSAQELSKLIDISVRIRPDGKASVVFGGGTLVDGDKGFKLKAIPSTSNPYRTAIGYYENPTSQYTDVSDKIAGGRLGGLLSVRDTEVQQARLSLDKIAFSLVRRSNDLNQSAIAPDTTTNHKVFNGSKASDITLNTVLRTNVTYIGSTRDAAVPGDIALIQAKVKAFYAFSSIESSPFSNIQTPAGAAIDPTLSINTLIPNLQSNPGAAVPGNEGEFVVQSGSNAVTIQWLGTDTLNEVIQKINTAGGGSFYATFDQTSRKLKIFGDGALTVYDTNLAFTRGFKLSAVAISSAPLNNNPQAALNAVDGAQALNSTQNALNFFTKPVADPVPASPFTAQVNGFSFTWTNANDPDSILAALTAATPAGRRVYSGFNPTEQIAYLVRSGDPGFNPGTNTAAVPNVSINIRDVTGNLTRFFNFDTEANGQSVLTQQVTTLSANIASETVAETQANLLVTDTQALQDAQSAVDLNQELAQARLYQRSYEASVKLQYIIDEMLNKLINGTGAQSSGSVV